MPAAQPLEFRRPAVDLARIGQRPVAKVAADPGISESCLRDAAALTPQPDIAPALESERLRSP